MHKNKIFIVISCSIIVTALFSCQQDQMRKGHLTKKTKNEIILPEPDGDYRVGTTILTFTDSTRRDIASPDSNQFRKLYTQIWYPTDEEGDPISYLGNENQAAGFEELEDTLWMTRFKRIRTNAIEEGRISNSQLNYPVLFFSAGFGLSKNYNTLFLEGLASQGYIVIGIDLTYVNPLVTEEGVAINPVGSYWDDFPMTKGIDDEELGKKKLEMANRYYYADYCFIYNELNRLNKTEFFHNAIDRTRVASMGHSAGVIPSIALMEVDNSPFKAFIIYDVNIHADYASETLLFPKLNKTNSPICLFILEYASLPSQEFITSINAELSIFALKGTNHSSISDIDFIRYSDENNIEGISNSLNNLNKIITMTTDFLNNNLSESDIQQRTTMHKSH